MEIGVSDSLTGLVGQRGEERGAKSMDMCIYVWETVSRAEADINHETDFVKVSVELGHGDHTPTSGHTPLLFQAWGEPCRGLLPSPWQTNNGDLQYRKKPGVWPISARDTCA